MRKKLWLVLLVVFFTLVGCNKTSKVEVAFATNGGTPIEVITTLEELRAGNYASTKEGYTFLGWFLDENFLIPFDANLELTNWVFTVYAKWEPNDKAYIVEHYQEKLDGEYELVKTDTKTGKIGLEVLAPWETYVGFSSNPSHEDSVDSLILTVSDQGKMQLYYSRNTYQIVFEEDGGSLVSDLSLKYGETITYPVSTKTGFDFGGWSEEVTTMPANNITATALWTEIPTFTVSFDSQGGGEFAPVQVMRDHVVERPRDAQKTGYQFIGWFAEGCPNPFVFETTISGDITLTAKYTALEVNYQIDQYIEDFNGNYTLLKTDQHQAVTDSVVSPLPLELTGFSESSIHPNRVASGTVLGDGTLTLAFYYSRDSYQLIIDEAGGNVVDDLLIKYEAEIVLPTLTKFGFELVGWQGLLATMPAQDVTITAVWKELPRFDVVFDANGGEDPLPQSIYQGYLASEPSAPKKIGYRFDGWFLGNAPSAFAFSTPITGNVSLKAQYTPLEVEYHISYYIEGLDGNYSLLKMDVAKALTDSTVAITPVAPLGFTQNSLHSNSVESGVVKGDGSLVLVFYFSRNSYTIAFEANAELSIQSIVAKYEALVSQPSSPVRNGYIFLGWYTDAELNNAYQFTVMPAANFTLYAKWQGEPTNLYFDTKGGSLINHLNARAGETISEPTAPTKEGFDFGGWYYDEQYTNPFTNWVMPIGGITVYSKWLPISYTIYFEENGGSEVLNITSPYQSSISAPIAPTKTGYFFAGWFLDVEVSHPYSFSAMPFGGLTLYAKWVSEEEGLSFGQLVILDPYTQVSVKGKVVLVAEEPYQGFYVSDGLNQLFVVGDYDNVILGSTVKFDATLIFQQGLPRLANIRNFEETPLNITMASPSSQTISILKTYEYNFFSLEMINVSGILTFNQGYYLTDESGQKSIVLSPIFNSSLLAQNIGNYLTLTGLYQQYLDEWVFAVVDVSTQPYTNAQKALLLNNYLDSMIPNTLESFERCSFLNLTDPFDFGSLEITINEEASLLYDSHKLWFKKVESNQNVVITVTINIGGDIFTQELTVVITPRSLQSVADFYAGDSGEVFHLHGIITMAIIDNQSFILKDATGFVLINGPLPCNYGDEVMVTITKDEHNDKGLYQENDYYQVLTTNNNLNIAPEQFDFETMDFNTWVNNNHQTRYVQFQGTLFDLDYDSSCFQHRIGNGNEFVSIDPISYGGYELLFDYVNQQVLISGYLFWISDFEPVLVFAGQRQEIEYLDYSDDERLDKIFADITMLSGNTLAPLVPISYPNMHPLLGGNIAWEIVQGNEYFIEKAGVFQFVLEPTEIKMAFTITYGASERTYLFTTMLTPPPILSIAEMKNLPAYEPVYVKGTVIYRDPQRVYLTDDTGLLYIDIWDANVYPGDRVVVHGTVAQDYSYPSLVWLVYDGTEYDYGFDPFAVYFMERETSFSIPYTTMTLIDALKIDVLNHDNYVKYVELTGYLDFANQAFDLYYGDFKITFDAIDAYTMHELAKLSNEFVTIKLMIEDYNGNWQFVYLGVDDSVSIKTLSLEEKQVMMKNWIEERLTEPLNAGESFYIPQVYDLFQAHITYELPDEYQDVLDFDLNVAANLVSSLTIPVTVNVLMDNVNYSFSDSISILTEEYVVTTTIASALELVNQTVSINARLLSPYAYKVDEYNSRYGMIVEDETGKLLVSCPEGFYFYNGSFTGSEFNVVGKILYHQGRYLLEAQTMVMGTKQTLTKVSEPLSIPNYFGMDHSFDQHLGQYVTVEGTVKRKNWSEFSLVGDNYEIPLYCVSSMQYDLSRYEGYLVSVDAFILGRGFGEYADQLVLIVNDVQYDGTPIIELRETSDEIIAHKILNFILENQERHLYFPYESIYVLTTHYLFNDAIIQYQVLNDSQTLLFSDYEFVVQPTEIDQDIDIEVSVTKGQAVAKAIFTVHIEGIVLNSLEELFVSNDNFEEISLEAKVIYYHFAFCYFLIDGEVYYHKENLGSYFNPGEKVLITGKKTTIEGVANYTYNFKVISMGSYGEILLTPVNATIDELYANNPPELDYRKELLMVSGKLGYDENSNFFYLEDNGKRIYIRHQLQEYGPTSIYSVGEIPYSLYTMLQYCGDYVSLELLFSDDIVFGDYLLLDFIPEFSMLYLQDATPEETLAITKEKIIDLYDGQTIISGEFLPWMYYDPIRSTSITYEPVDPNLRAIYFEDQMGLYGLIVNEEIEVSILASLLYFDPITQTNFESSIIFTVTVKPIIETTIHDVIYGFIGDEYLIKGVIQMIDPETFMVIKDLTGTIYLELNDAYQDLEGLKVGDEVLVLAMRNTYYRQGYVPVLNGVKDVVVVSENNVVNPVSTTMTIDDILNLDYHDLDSFGHYINISGKVIFSGNTWYPSYDLRENGFVDDKYDLMMWSDDYDAFNALMDPLVGSNVRVEGYLVGFEYIYEAFNWIIRVVNVSLPTN